MKKKNIIRAVIGLSALLLSGLLMALAKYANSWFFSFYPQFSAALEGALAEVTGVFPFSVYDMLCVIGIAALIVNLILGIKRKRFYKWVTAFFMTACLLVFGFTLTWGLNHLGPGITERLGFEVSRYTVDQLEEATVYYMDRAGENADLLPQADDGTTVFSDFRTLAKEASEGYKVLESQGYTIFGGTDAPPKPLTFGKIYSYMGYTGIFIFLTGESNVNPNAYIASIPFTMCHELAHRKSVAQEQGANFCAFLACSASKNPEFNYSGFYSAFIYCYNSLYKASPERALALWDAASPRLYADIIASNRHYHKYEGKVQDAAQSINDSYLKAYGETQGIQSYGAVTDSLIAWYLANGI